MRAALDTLKAPRSFIIAIGVSAVVFAFSVWLPNADLLFIVFTSTAPLADKITLPLSLLLSIATNFTLLSTFYTIAIAILSGINIALMAELMRTRQMYAGGAIAGASGLVAGVLGVGCAACGSLILTALAVTVFGTGAFAFFPLGGEEFGILGVLLLGFSTYLLSKQISKTVCEITI